MTIGVLYYFALRTTITKETRIKYLLYIYSWVLFVFALIAIVSFQSHTNAIEAAGFSDLHPFRYLYTSLGFSCNVWGTFLIGFLGIMALACYYNRFNKKRRNITIIMMIPVLIGIVRSFSRGIYISLLILFSVFIIAVLRSKMSIKNKLGIFSIIFVIIACIVIPHRKEVLTTLGMTTTISQKRSIDYRIKDNDVAFEILKEHPLFGVGSSNHSLAANEYIYENDNVNYIPITSGLVAQLTSEKGIVGVTLFLVFIGVVIKMLFKEQNRNYGTLIVFACCGALLIRDLTFPVLFDYKGLQVIFLTFLAIYQNRYHAIKEPLATKNTTYIKWLPFVMILMLIAINKRFEHLKEVNDKAIFEFTTGHLNNAMSTISSIENHIPLSINRCVIDWKMYQETHDSHFLVDAENSLKNAITKNPYDIQLKCYLAVIHYAKGEYDMATERMRELVSHFPNNALFRLTLFKFLEDNNNDNISDEAILNLCEAVLLSPRIMETPIFKSIMNNDKSFDDIKDKILIKISYIDDDPIKLARKGKILMVLGDTISAKACLEKSVSNLPNLILPYCYLGIIYCENGDIASGREYFEKAMVLSSSERLTYRCLNKYCNESYDDVDDWSDYSFLFERYGIKFYNWYKTDNLMFDYFMSDIPSG